MSSPYSKSFTSCELWVTNRSHVLLPVPLLFTPITSNSLQEDTQSCFLLRFKCPCHLSCPCLCCTSASLTRLGRKQFGIFGQLEYNYNTIFRRFGIQQPDACTWAVHNDSTIVKPSKWRHCDREHCKKKMKILKRAKWRHCDPEHCKKKMKIRKRA